MSKSFKEKIFKSFYLCCATVGIIGVLVIAFFLFAQGLPSIFEIGFFKFLFGSKWNPTLGQFGILPMIVNSIYVTFLAVIIGVGIGVMSAIYLAYFCPKRLQRILKNIINLLAGIPSVVFGFFGMQIIVPFFAMISPTGVGYGIAASGIILGIMILPTVVSVSLNSLNNVPRSYYEGALSLGATHEQAVFKIAVPSAKNGILASSILGIGRAIGETMAVVMVSGNIPKFATSIFQSIRTMTGNIVLEMSYAEGLHLGALIGTGVVLFVFILLITLTLNIINNRANKQSDKHSLVHKLRARVGRNKTRGLTTGGVVMKSLSYVAIILTMISFLGIILFTLIRGVPYLSFDLIFGKFEYGGKVTLLPSIVTTLMLIFLTLIITIPIGVCSAIYLVEYTKKGNKFVKIIRGGIETLAGIPSIIYGLFGMIFFSNVLGLGYSILSGSLTLVLMILPIIIRTTEQALLEVPDSYREGSLALGAGKTRTIFKVVLPSAISGIITGIILSIGRIIGESAAVLFTVGSTKAMPSGFGSSGISLAVFMYVLAGEGMHVNEAYATAVVLLILVFLINMASSLIESRIKRRVSGNEKRKKSELQLKDNNICVRDLNLHYGDFQALKNVNMDIQQNQITAFIGPSGCGKSTLLKCFNRMNDLVENCKIDGQITIGGVDITKNIEVAELRKNVGMVFQKPNPFPMSIYDNIAYAPRTFGIKKKADLDRIVEESLTKAAMWDEAKDRLNKSALGMSGGQQQRLCIARCLAIEPKILLMDEPTSALDPISTGKIEELCMSLKDSLTIVIVTHNMQQAVRISDQTAYFLLGEMVEMDNTSDLFEKPKDKRTENYITGRFG